MVTLTRPPSTEAAGATRIDQMPDETARMAAPEPRDDGTPHRPDRAPPFAEVSSSAILKELNTNLGRMHAAAANARAQGRFDEAARLEAAIAAMETDIARVSTR